VSASKPVKQAAKKVFSPVLSYSDGQFAALQDQIGSMRSRFDELETQVASDARTVAELATTTGRSNARVAEELSNLASFLSAGEGRLPVLLRGAMDGDPAAEVELAELLRDLVPHLADRLAGEHAGVDVTAMGPGLAHLLNWAEGHTGPAAQAGAWFNPAVTVVHEPGAVRPNDVNERIVEVPFAMGVAATLAPGSLVLDFGATESTVSLSMASLGLDVLASDLRPHPLAHPRLRSVTGPVEDWEGPERPLDAVFSISALEHVGLGAYGEEATASDLDRRIVERFAGWLRPCGELVLTAPYGRWAVDELQRTYDAEHLAALLEGWDVLDRRVGVQTGRATWETTTEEPPADTWQDGTRGVVLVRATPQT
jgi:2-polyprenyl-3-methyl-5-hydroxy-6-metoxy-1,4-benzoquinol methylase